MYIYMCIYNIYIYIYIYIYNIYIDIYKLYMQRLFLNGMKEES